MAGPEIANSNRQFPLSKSGDFWETLSFNQGFTSIDRQALAPAPSRDTSGMLGSFNWHCRLAAPVGQLKLTATSLCRIFGELASLIGLAISRAAPRWGLSQIWDPSPTRHLLFFNRPLD